MGEFDLIERYFKRPAQRSPLGVGDDCALLAPARGHAARGVLRHAGRGPPFPFHRRPGAAGPQGAGGQPERPGGLRREAAGLHARARAAGGRRGLARSLLARPVRAGRCAWLRAGRRRHHARPAQPLHHRLRRGAGRRGAAALRRASRATSSGPAARSAMRGSRWKSSAARWRCRPRPSNWRAAHGAARRRASRWARRCAASPRRRSISATGWSATSATSSRPAAWAPRWMPTPPAALIAVRADTANAALLTRNCGAPARWPAATTTSCSSARHPPQAAAVLEAGRQSATPVARIGRIEAAPGLRIVDAQGAPVAQRFAAFDHFQATASRPDVPKPAAGGRVETGSAKSLS